MAVSVIPSLILLCPGRTHGNHHGHLIQLKTLEFLNSSPHRNRSEAPDIQNSQCLSGGTPTAEMTQTQTSDDQNKPVTFHDLASIMTIKHQLPPCPRSRQLRLLYNHRPTHPHANGRPWGRHCRIGPSDAVRLARVHPFGSVRDPSCLSNARIARSPSTQRRRGRVCRVRLLTIAVFNWGRGTSGGIQKGGGAPGVVFQMDSTH